MPALILRLLTRALVWAGLVIAALALLSTFAMISPALYPLLPIERFRGGWCSSSRSPPCYSARATDVRPPDRNPLICTPGIPSGTRPRAPAELSFYTTVRGIRSTLEPTHIGPASF